MDQFFQKGRLYAVTGASTNKDKFGYKVFRWYKDRNIEAVPINFRKDIIDGVQSIESIGQLDIPNGAEGVGLSVVTPPAVTKEMLDTIESAPKLKSSVKAIWLQPGTYNEDIVNFAKSVCPVVIKDCILVNGDQFLSKL